MKIRWIGPILIASLIALAGCAPSQTGGERSASPESAPVQTTPSADAEEPSDAPADNPGSSDYDY
ncbi:MAG: hypothetical protein ACXWWL_05550 [Candidatus Limnocylindria bacterium]